MSAMGKKRGRPSAAQGQLTPERIILCARQLMQQQGKVPSIRQLTGELGVDAMAIYHYFANKSALLEAVTVSLVEAIYEPQDDGDWQGELHRLCHSYLDLLREHPGLLETMLSMSSFGPAQVFCERLASALSPLELNEAAFVQARDLLADYLHGVAIAMQCNPGACQEESIDSSLKLICSGIRQLT